MVIACMSAEIKRNWKHLQNFLYTNLTGMAETHLPKLKKSITTVYSRDISCDTIHPIFICTKQKSFEIYLVTDMWWCWWYTHGKHVSWHNTRLSKWMHNAMIQQLPKVCTLIQLSRDYKVIVSMCANTYYSYNYTTSYMLQAMSTHFENAACPYRDTKVRLSAGEGPLL